MRIRNSFFCLTLAALFLMACGKDSPKDSSSSQPETASPATPDPAPDQDPITVKKAEIIQVLEAYYGDLEAENIDAATYFAPTVEQFFSSTKLPLARIQTSLDNGFAQLDDRQVTLDTEGIKVQADGDRWIVTFTGQVAYTKTPSGEKVDTNFGNRITFDQDLKILRYEDADAPMTTSRGTSTAGNDPLMTLSELVLRCFRTANYGPLAEYIHPEKGFFVVTHPGAISMPYAVSSTELMLEKVPYLDQGMPKLDARPQQAPLPDFNCGDYFSKEGCFIGPAQEFNLMSSLMETVNQVEPGIFASADIVTAKGIEALAQQQIVDTDAEAGFYLGQIDGRWYLLVVDIASYDCSA